MIWVIHFSMINIILFFSKIFKNDKIFIIGSFSYSVIVFGQRWMTGVDFPGYLLYYLIDFNGVEPSYYFLQNILATNNIYFGILIFITFFLTLINFYRLISKFESKKILMIYLYCFLEIYFIQMSQIRQGISISFFINAFFYMYNNKKYKAIINALAALSFHISTFLVIPFLFIKPKLSRKTSFYICLIFIVLPFIDITFIIEFFRIGFYSNYIDSVYDVSLGVSHYFRYYLSLFGTLLYIYNFKNIEKDNFFYCTVNGQLLYLLFYALSFKYAPIFRISNYFKIFELVFFVYNAKKINRISKRTLTLSMIGIVFLLYSSISLLDPYDISRYEFRALRIRETKSVNELFSEINRFYLEE